MSGFPGAATFQREPRDGAKHRQPRRSQTRRMSSMVQPPAGFRRIAAKTSPVFPTPLDTAGGT